MSEKFNDKKVSITNMNARKRDKFIKPLITDEDINDDNDVFFSIVKNRSRQDALRRDHEKKSSYFLSPMRGKVEDRSTFPVTSSKGKIGKQYDFLRQDKKIKKDDIKKNNGHEYYEFNLINSHKKQEILKKQGNETKKVENVPRKETVQPQRYVVETPIEEKVKIDEVSPTKITKETINDINHSLYDDPKVNIIYEEEIDIDDNKSIITSYDENSKISFFNDFDKIHVPQKSNSLNSKVEVYNHHEETKGLKAELKKLFAEDDYKFDETVYFKEELDQDIKPKTTYVPKQETVTRKPQEPITRKNDDNENKSSKFNFINLKEELDQELNIHKKNENKEINVNDLAHYTFPPVDLLAENTTFIKDETEWILEQVERLDATLESFGIAARTVNHTQGPSVTRFEVEPEPGTKVSKITALQDDIKLRLAASDIRMEAPISGKSTVGVEVPNKETRMVKIREILDSTAYKNFKSPLKIALGLDITGEPIFSDISNMTHSLIAGSTGSGKSVCINGIIVSILYNAMPDEVKLVLIDPKKVEFSLYRDIPHLLTPVINDPKIATATLRWLTEEMDRRYELIESVGARDIKSYNIKRNRSHEDLPKLPYIVVIIDELADLMMIAAQEVEEYIQRISQLARAAGIHLIVATQRPSTNVITGTIKTNIPTRIAFKVASAIDSRIILDESGAEKLLGRGDMLLSDNGKPQLKRLQGAFVGDEEIEKITDYVKKQFSPNYLFTGEDLVKKENEFTIDYDDELFDDVVRFVIELGEASASRIQRQFKVGYNRAARIIDMMEKHNIIGPQQNGSKPRDVLMSIDDYEEMIYS